MTRGRLFASHLLTPLSDGLMVAGMNAKFIIGPA